MPLLEIHPETRRRGRYLLWGGLSSILVLLIGAAWLLDKSGTRREDDLFEAGDFESHPDVRLLQEYVRIDTSPTTGSELEGARFLARQFEAAGIPARVEQLGGGKANFWAILEGESPEAVVLHSHIDVFPVENESLWTHPPFSGTIDQAWMYGRGVFDMKSLAIAQLRAMLDLAASGSKPRKSVIFLATGSEEVGSELGASWVLAQHPELTERVWVLLSEGGVVEPRSRSEIKYWGIEFAQKRFSAVEICSDDRQRLEQLREQIVRWGETAQRWQVRPELTGFFAEYARSRDRELYRDLLEEPEATIHDPDRFRRLPAYLQSMFRDEAVPWPVEESAEGGYRMRLLFHMLPGSDLEEVRARLLPEWLLHGFSVAFEEPLGTSEPSDLGHPAFTILEEAIAERYPEALIGPYFLPWSATDSRFFRVAGIPCFGFSPFVIFTTDTYRVDTGNERIDLPGYIDGVALYSDAVRRLAG